MHIRVAEFNDLQQIVKIYNQAVEIKGATADLEPISTKECSDWIAKHKPKENPIWVYDNGEFVVGWCSLAHYRRGRQALMKTKRIAYYVHKEYQRQGVATALIQHAIVECKQLNVKSLFALVLDINTGSIKLLEKFGFERWGHMPNIAEIDGGQYGHLIYGKHVAE